MREKKFIRSNPHLPVKSLRETLDYYRDILGFYDEWTWANIDGKILDGGIRRNDMRLLFAEDSHFAEDINNQNHRLPLLWFVENIDEVFFEFKEKDVEIIDNLHIHPYGLREFAFIDINGYCIRVAEETGEK